MASSTSPGLIARLWRRMASAMFTVAALYHFTRFNDPAAVQGPLAKLCCELGVKGTLLLAGEGINGTIAGEKDAITEVLAHIDRLPGCAGFEYKLSTASQMPFRRMKVRLKREIVTMGQPDVDPIEQVGKYIKPEDWNDLIASDDVAIIDTRNDYEVAIGSFKGAVDPQTKSFGEFPKWWEENSHQFEGKKIAMFCTGGIRCEKSTNYLLGQGVEDVFHLQGGILKYLEEVPKDETLFDGECFVFDGRVSVGHGLVEGPHELCFACRRAILPDDHERPEFEDGVSCHHCIDETTEDAKSGFRERQKQIALSKKRRSNL